MAGLMKRQVPCKADKIAESSICRQRPFLRVALPSPSSPSSRPWQRVQTPDVTMQPPNPELRRQVIAIYKGTFHCSLSDTRASTLPVIKTATLTTCRRPELLNLGKDYPQGFDFFRPRLHRAFIANAHLRDEEQIRKGIARAEFVRKGAVLPGPSTTTSKAYVSACHQMSCECKMASWLTYGVLQRSRLCKSHCFVFRSNYRATSDTS